MRLSGVYTDSELIRIINFLDQVLRQCQVVQQVIFKQVTFNR